MEETEQSDNDNSDTLDQEDADVSPLQRFTMICLIITDATDLFLLSGSTVLLPEMQSDLGFSDAAALRLSASLMACAVVSKLVVGPVIDHVGGKGVLVLCLGANTVSVLALSASSSVTHAAVALTAIGTFHGPAYSAQAEIVRWVFYPAPERMFRALGVTSRAAAAATGALYTLLLRVLGWRNTLRASAAAGLAAALVASVGLPKQRGRAASTAAAPAALMAVVEGIGGGGGGEKDESSGALGPPASAEDSSWQSSRGASGDGGEGVQGGLLRAGTRADRATPQGRTPLPPLPRSSPPPRRRGGLWVRLRGLARRAWFRWGLVGSGCMAAVANVYPLLPLFFADTCRGLPPRYTAVLSSSLPLGILAANLGPGLVYSRLRPAGRGGGGAPWGGCGGSRRATAAAAAAVETTTKKKVIAVGLLVAALGCALGLVAVGGASHGAAGVAAKAALTFGLGAGLGVGWYIPLPSAAATLAAGDTGLCQSLFDAVGYAGAVATQVAASFLLAKAGGGGDEAGGGEEEEEEYASSLGRAWRLVWALESALALGAVLAMARFFDAANAATAPSQDDDFGDDSQDVTEEAGAFGTSGGEGATTAAPPPPPSSFLSSGPSLATSAGPRSSRRAFRAGRAVGFYVPIDPPRFQAAACSADDAAAADPPEQQKEGSYVETPLIEAPLQS